MINVGYRYRMTRAWLGIFSGVATWAISIAAFGADHNRLWNIVHNQCIPPAMRNAGNGPCAEVDLLHHIAVLKDSIGATQYLLIPTDPIEGIEDPAILAPSAPNYAELAWRARRYVAARVGRPLPRNALALAVNSKLGRTQNQLHIHIDCIRPDVKRTLNHYAAGLDTNWRRLDSSLLGHPYRARRVDGQDLVVNPFRLLAEDIKAPDQMGRETLVIVGWDFPTAKPGFIVLADGAKPETGDFGAGEEIEDHTCSVLHDNSASVTP